MKKHMIIGASGQVGGYLYQNLLKWGEEVVGTYYRHPHSDLVALDMTNRQTVRELIGATQPDVIWIPAAMANVDQCEQEPDVSYQQNVVAPRIVADVAVQEQARVVFFSTDYVFDGVDGPYGEERPVHPIQVYGQHKAESEHYLLSQIPHSVIIRPAWIYSRDETPRNFVYRVVEQLKARQPVKAVTDQFNTPTPSEGLVKIAWQAVQDGFEGIVHIAGPERLSRYALTRRIAQAFGYSPNLVEPVQTESFHLPAARPLNGGLITQHARYRMEAGRDFAPVF